MLVTNGESPIEMEDWEAVIKKMNALDISLTIMYVPLHYSAYTIHKFRISGVDFDDPEFPYEEPDKSVIKVRLNASDNHGHCNFCRGQTRSFITHLSAH